MSGPRRWELWVGAVGVLCVAWAHYTGLFVAPPEMMMGDVGRILYAHVPTAWTGLLTYVVAFVAAIGALWSGRVAWDALVEASVEVGVLLNALLLIQGSLWARPTWGVFWTWDPRLTTSAIMVVAFGVILVLRGAIDAPIRRMTVSAVATIVAFVDVPIVYLSVKWWKTMHQPYSSPDTVDSVMVTPLRVAAIGMILVATALVMARWRIASRRLTAERAQPDLPDAAARLTIGEEA